MRVLATIALAFSSAAHAGGPYLELGLWQPTESDQVVGAEKAKVAAQQPGTPVPGWQPVAGPYGSIEVGYTVDTRIGTFAVAGFHLSSVSTNKDRGANLLGVTYRWQK